MLFQGSMVALVTPFKNGQIDKQSLQNLVRWHIENKTQVIVPCGTTGESATLSHKEHQHVIELVVEAADKKVKVLAGAGSNNTSEALELNQCAQKAGADGALHITPYYNKPTQEGLYQHYKALSESGEFPIVLYNVPSRTSVSLHLDTILKLTEQKNIVGIKEASGDLVLASQILQKAPQKFGYYSGEDALNYPLYALGAHGSISVTANVAPLAVSQLFLHMQNKAFDMAQKIHYELLALNQVLFIETNPIPVKAALNLMGLIEEEYRLPLVKISAKAREKLKSVLIEQKCIF